MLISFAFTDLPVLVNLFFWGGRRPWGFVTVSLVWYLPHSHLFRSFLSLSQKHLLFNFGRMVEDFFLQKGIVFRFWSATCFGFRNRFSASLVWLDSFSKQLPYSVRCGIFLAKSANIVFQASVFSYSGLPLCIRSSRMQMGHGDDRGADCEWSFGGDSVQNCVYRAHHSIQYRAFSTPITACFDHVCNMQWMWSFGKDSTETADLPEKASSGNSENSAGWEAAATVHSQNGSSTAAAALENLHKLMKCTQDVQSQLHSLGNRAKWTNINKSAANCR